MLTLNGADALRRVWPAQDLQQCGRARLWPSATGRKNWLFTGSDAGGARAATIYTLVETARLNALDPEAYLRDVLGHIAGHPINRISELLPRNIAAPQAG